MKKVFITLGLISSLLTFTMCESSNKQKKEVVEEKEKTNEEKESSCMIPIAPGDSAKYLSKNLTISGDVMNELNLTVDSLKKMKIHTIENFDVVCQSGANMKHNDISKGVLLKDLLDKAKIEQLNHKDRNFYIVARATDGYKATFSWAEIFNNPTGDNVFVLFEENGKPIKVQGDFILICKNDIKTGPRHVYWLKSIEINRVE